MRNINILFLGGAKRVSLAESFIKSGKELNLKVNIYSYELTKEVPIFFVAKEVIIGKKWQDENIIEDIKSLINKKKIDIILPFLDTATIFLSKIKDQIEQNVFCPVSDYNNVNVFYNKIKTNKWCIENNIPVPSNNFDDFPLIAKPVFGSSSKGIIKINDKKQLNQINKSEYLIQKFINGKEYSVDCYVSTNGDIISITPRERLETQGGESIKSITVKDKFLIEISRQILKKSKLVGPITIQFLKEKETDKIYFMELNPRFGGAVLTSIAAGANIPKYLLKNFLGQNITYNEDWKNNLLMIRRFKEYYISCE